MSKFVRNVSLYLLIIIVAVSIIDAFTTNKADKSEISYTNFMNYSNKKAFMDYTYFTPQVDKLYAQGIIEGRLSSFGIVIVKKQEEADIIVQPLCGVLGTDHDKFMIGTPSLPIPVPDTGMSFAIPEIPLFSKITRRAYGKFSTIR